MMIGVQPEKTTPYDNHENADILEQMYKTVSSRLQLHEQAIMDRIEVLEIELKKHRQHNEDAWRPSSRFHTFTERRSTNSVALSSIASVPDQWRLEQHSTATASPSRNSSSGTVGQLERTQSVTNILSLFSSFHRESGPRWIAKAFPAVDKGNRSSQLLRSWQFNCVVSLLIVTNSLIIGFQTNFSTGDSFASALDRPSRALDLNFPAWTNTLFATFFMLELTFRLFVERGDFFFGGNAKWNLFDLFLVLSTLLELIAETRNITFARALRLLRIIHVLQVIRVFKVFDVLRYMLYSILNSMVSVLWVILLMTLLLYVYGNFVISIVGNHVDEVVRGEHPQIGNEQDQASHLAQLDEMFGTISRSILYLFAAVTGGKDWMITFQLMTKVHWTFAISFLVFYVFIALGVLNIVTGIFVERATELTAFDKEITIMSNIDNMERLVSDLEEFFHETDVDHDGMVTWEEFGRKMRHKEVIAYLQTLGIDVTDALRVFQLLDRRGDGQVAIRDFVEGCIHVKGTAQSMDVCMLQQDVRRLGNMLEVLMHYTEDQLSKLRGREVNSIGARLQTLATRNSTNRSFHHISTCFNWDGKDTSSHGKDSPGPEATPAPHDWPVEV